MDELHGKIHLQIDVTMSGVYRYNFTNKGNTTYNYTTVM